MGPSELKYFFKSFKILYRMNGNNRPSYMDVSNTRRAINAIIILPINRINYLVSK